MHSSFFQSLLSMTFSQLKQKNCKRRQNVSVRIFALTDISGWSALIINISTRFPKHEKKFNPKIPAAKREPRKSNLILGGGRHMSCIFLSARCFLLKWFLWIPSLLFQGSPFLLGFMTTGIRNHGEANSEKVQHESRSRLISDFLGGFRSPIGSHNRKASIRMTR